jgi:sugar O-acyltransferase (sialic acid O-acetyltransferase NeuD family)
MKKKLVVFGLGKVADVALAHFLRDGVEVVALTCDREWLTTGAMVRSALPLIAFDEIEQHFDPAHHDMFVAMGYHELNAVRAAKCAQARVKGYRLFSYISPRADVGPWLELGDNCLILDGAGVQPGARIGDNVSIWNNVLVGHHAVVEDDAWLAAGATLGGLVRVGRACFVGLNATLGGEAQIGASSFIGAGALVLKSADPMSVFVQAGTEKFRLDSQQFLRMTRMPAIGRGRP